MIEANLMAAGAKRTTLEPEAIDFDGTNDYLSRSTDLVGNADSKTFTLSGWVYAENSSSSELFYFARDESGASNGFIFRSQSGYFRVVGYDASATTILLVDLPAGSVPSNTFTHLALSVDLSDVGKRHAFLNDNDVTGSSSWSTYTNDIIDFTKPDHFVAATVGSLAAFEGRLAHLYLDYTYRDLSIEANRRLFITADGKPAKGQESLSPILYLPLDDFEAPGVNLGTGGDFTLNGVVAQSGSGPNQWNCVASEFDGTSDYLRQASISGLADSKQITFSFSINADVNEKFVMAFDISSAYFYVWVTGGKLNIVGRDSSGTVILNYTSDTTFYVGRNYSVSASIDLSSASLRAVLVDSLLDTGTYGTYTDSNIKFTGMTNYFIGTRVTGAAYFNGSIGELYFDTTYIDLATNNPFWDADAGKPKPVLQVLEETGNTPLIAMPIRADDAGRNYGTGGDFTVNSGPFVGARGASEFWARSAKFDGSTGYMSRGALAGAADGKKLTIVCSKYYASSASNQDTLIDLSNGSNIGIQLNFNSSNTGYIQGRDAANTGNVGRFDYSFTYPSGWFTLMFCLDMDDSSKSKLYINNNSTAITEIRFFTGATLDFTTSQNRIGQDFNGGDWLSGDAGFIYFTTDYIDFSQEANRLKFVDAFGYPVDIRPAIEAGDIPTPMIYMPFDDPNDLGKNLGTGGDFTVNGTVTPGADVDPN